MKRFTVLLALILATFSVSALDAEFYGVFYCTKAPTPADKVSGEVYLTLSSDNTIDLECYQNELLIETGSGTYTTAKNGLIKFTLIDDDQNVWIGTLKAGFLSGKFKAGSQSGKFQCTAIVE